MSQKPILAFNLVQRRRLIASTMKTLALFLAALLQGSFSATCPFDNGNNCDCVSDPSGKPNTFESAECRLTNGKFSPFSSSIKYTITNELAIMSDSVNIAIPANAFSGFSSINRLSFLNSAFSTVVSISLDPSSFNGVTINALTFSGFDVLPLPAAVRSAGQNGLNELVIQNGHLESLDANQFQGFTNLVILTIYNVQITSVSDMAFSGLENILQYLTLSNAYIYTYPGKALSKLTKLVFLDLSGNNMYSWGPAAFSTMTSLKELQLRQNILQSAIDSGAFNNFPASVEFMDLSGGNLQKVPKSVLSNAHGLVELKLATNLISTLEKNDFPDNLKLTSLDLSENPFVSIDQDAFKPLKSVESLRMRQSTLKTIDLALFNGMDNLKVLNLDFQRTLKIGVKVSDANKVPQSLQKISVAYTGLDSLDANLEKIITRSNFKSIDLTRDVGLNCDISLKWMAKYAICSERRINVDGARCSTINSQLLRDYLKDMTPC